jgi:hypothetical protein
MASNHSDFIPSALTSQSYNKQRTSPSEPSAYYSGITKKTRLPVEYPPSDYSVVCGRGKDSFNHVGNRRFRILASMFIDRYSRADSKIAKSAIVSEIIAVIRQAGGTFCKYQKGAWADVGEHQAREKVSSLLRDLLHTEYRSSAKAKVARRWSQSMQNNQDQQSGQAKVDRRYSTPQHQDQRPCQERVVDTEHSDDCSTTSSCWGTNDSLEFDYWLEEPADFFDIDVF